MMKNMMKNRQDKLLAFFDAILAIAITMLALEINIPQIGTLSADERYNFFVVVTCYLISFTAMGSLWYVHANFFSNHELTGRAGEIVLHLVLLFVITLFQPLTKAVGEFPEDNWVRLLYIAAFLLMYGLGIVIFVVVRNGEDKRQAQQESMKQIYKDLKSHTDNTEESETDKLLRLLYTVQNPEEMIKAAQKNMPEEYKETIARMRLERQKSFRISVISTVVMALAISASVICLIFPIWLCYLSLGLGFAAVILIKFFSGK